MWLNSSDLDAFSLFHQLRDTTQDREEKNDAFGSIYLSPLASTYRGLGLGDFSRSVEFEGQLKTSRCVKEFQREQDEIWL